MWVAYSGGIELAAELGHRVFIPDVVLGDVEVGAEFLVEFFFGE